MRINTTANSLEQALTRISNRKSRDFSVPKYTTANQLSSVVENDVKAKLWDNRHGMTDFRYNIKDFLNAQMNFTQRL